KPIQNKIVDCNIKNVVFAICVGGMGENSSSVNRHVLINQRKIPSNLKSATIGNRDVVHRGRGDTSFTDQSIIYDVRGQVTGGSKRNVQSARRIRSEGVETLNNKYRRSDILTV